MKRFLTLLTAILFAHHAHGQQALAEYEWQKLASQIPGASVVKLDGRQALKIENTNDAPLQVSLLSIDHPPITQKIYSIRSQIRYDDVKGDGYLEMWNYFPPAAHYFSRTLADSGPLKKIHGSSSWREFNVPFDATGASNSPTRLEFNLHLAGRGTVYLSPLKLMQYSGSDLSAVLAPPGAWWSDRTAGLIGGIGGTFFGILFWTSAWFAYKGMARALVMTLLIILSGLGAVLAVVAVLALAQHQPYAVWFPLTLGALSLLCICPFGLVLFQKHYSKLELRRMASLDASGA